MPEKTKQENKCCDSPCHHCPYFQNDCINCHLPQQESELCIKGGNFGCLCKNCKQEFMESLPQQPDGIVEHAGSYHYASCSFPTVDAAVCNCPKGLKKFYKVPPLEEKWEELTEIVYKIYKNWENDDEVGLFTELKSLLSKVKEEAYKEGLYKGYEEEGNNCYKHTEQTKHDTLALVKKIVEGKKKRLSEFTHYRQKAKKDAYNQALEDILAELKKLE